MTATVAPHPPHVGRLSTGLVLAAIAGVLIAAVILSAGPLVRTFGGTFPETLKAFLADRFAELGTRPARPRQVVSLPVPPALVKEPVAKKTRAAPEPVTPATPVAAKPVVATQAPRQTAFPTPARKPAPPAAEPQTQRAAVMVEPAEPAKPQITSEEDAEWNVRVSFSRKALDGKAAGGRMLAIGEKILQGGGADANARALPWFIMAAQEGNAMGAFNAGQIIRLGRIGDAPDAQALSWYKRAAEKGFVPAQLNLGLMYLGGRGAARDRDEGREWLRRAAAAGSAKAREVLLETGY